MIPLESRISPRNHPPLELSEIHHRRVHFQLYLFHLARRRRVHGQDNSVERARQGEDPDIACLSGELGAVFQDG
jgi:hypothetical protein